MCLRGVFVLVFFLLSFGAYSQKAIDTNIQGNSIEGIVVDADNQAIEFAQLELIGASDSALIATSVTNNIGKYEIKDLQSGKYLLIIKSMGFGDQTIAISLLTGQNNLHLTDTIRLTARSKHIDDIEILGNAKAIEQKLEKKIINVGKDIDAGAGSALDILEKAPSLKVDAEGALSIRGNSNVTILIDGRPQSAVDNSVLSSLPASSIERIELMSNPSAKYQSNGTAGIINIILKKNKKNVVRAIAGAKIGTGDKYAGNINTFVGKEIWNFNIQAVYNSLSRFNISTRYRDLQLDTSLYFNDYWSYRKYTHNNHYVNAGTGIDYKNFYLFGNVKFGLFQLLKYKSGTQRQWDDYHASDNNSWNDYSSNIQTTFREVNLNAKYRSTDKKHTIEAEYFQSNESGNDYYTLVSEMLTAGDQRTGSIARNQQRLVNSYRYYQSKIDYSLSLDSGKYFETGLYYKNHIRLHLFSNGVFDQTTKQWNYSGMIENEIPVDHTAIATYINYNGYSGKLEYNAGIRAEQEKRNIGVSNADTVFDYKALELFPSVSVSFRINSTYKLSASYGRRKEIPRHWLIIPNTYINDKFVRTQFNAELLPQYASKLEAGLHYDLKKVSGSATLFVSDLKNEVWQMHNVSGIYNLYQYTNIDRHLTEGIELNNNIKWNKVLGTAINSNIYYNQFEDVFDSQTVDNSNTAWDLNIIASINLSKTMRMEINNMYFSKYAMPQGYFKSSGFTNISIEKSFMNKNLSVSLKTNDIFQTRKKGGEVLQFKYCYDKYSNWELRSVLLSISYNFNKYNFKAKTTEIERGGL